MIYTIGHSTRQADDFVDLLRVHGVLQVADVRSFPRSRRHPHFSKEALEGFLSERGIGYRHFPQLGGHRKPAPDSRNTAWREAGFRGYADHMLSAEFGGGLRALMEFSASAATAAMCAESVWWRCHRRLLSDALVARGITVLHIVSRSAPNPHHLSEFARVEGTIVTYPGLV